MCSFVISQPTNQKIEKATSYRQMTENWAWKDFWKFIEDTRAQALENAIVSDDLKEIQIWRGQVPCIDALKSHLDFILEGL